MKHQTDLGKDSIPSLVLKLAGPAMLAQFVNVLYSIIDRMYIGHIPKTGALALAGAGNLRSHRHSAFFLWNACGAGRFHPSRHPSG